MTDEPGLDLLAVEAFTWTPTLETACEVCLRYVAEGRRVGFAFLDVENVDQFPEMTGVTIGSLLYAAGRKARQERVRTIEAILRSRGVTVLRTVAAQESVPRLTAVQAGIDSIASLRDFRFKGAALGFGALSTLIRHTGDSDPDFETNRALIDRILNSACQSFLLTDELIERWKPKEILLYNGRLAVSKAISEAARLADVQTLHHEIASTKDRFYLSHDPVHSQRLSRRRLRKLWASAAEDREQVAQKYFQPQRGGITMFETSFLQLRNRHEQLPRNGRRRIAFFTSSIDEYAAIEDGFENPLFESQHCAAEWLASWVRGRQETELVIRMHPRMNNLSARERNRWLSMAGANITVLMPDSPVDSYGLAGSADRVVVYHSSIGAEATYLGRVSIIVGDADYRGLDCVYEPRSTGELSEMLLDPTLKPKRQENCLPYGYQRLMRGEPYLFYQPVSFAEGGFFGQRVIPDKRLPLAAGLAMKILRRLKGVGAGRVVRSRVSLRK